MLTSLLLLLKGINARRGQAVGLEVLPDFNAVRGVEVGAKRKMVSLSTMSMPQIWETPKVIHLAG